MRCVIDTNQIVQLTRAPHLTSKQKREITLVLPTLVWEEYVLRPRPQQGLREIARYNVRFGIGERDALEAVRLLTDAQIRGFEPFVPKKSNLQKKLLADLKKCDQSHIDLARANAAQRRLDTRQIATTVRANAKKERDARSRGEPLALIENMKDINECLRVSRNAFVRSGEPLPGAESNRPTSSDALESFRPLPNAALENPYLVRFFRMFSAQISAFQGMWENKDLNITASENRNDYTDMSLALYANDGDIILSNDAKFRRLFEHCEPERRVRVMTWHQYLDSFL